MAQGDQNLIFSSNQAITSSAGSTFVYDMATGPIAAAGGTYLTNAAAGLNLTFGNATYFGQDLGIGFLRLKMGVWTEAAFAGGTSLQISWQLAPDNGSGTIAGLNWTSYATGNAIPTAQLAGQLVQIPVPDWPYDIIGGSNPPPRFVRLFYTVGGPNFTAGALSAGVVNALSFNRIGAYPSGFSVGA